MKHIVSVVLIITGFLLVKVELYAVSISCSPDPCIQTVGQNVTVSVNLDTPTQFRGYSVRIAYNTSILSYQSAVKGSLLNGYSIGWWRAYNGSPNETPGVLRIECIAFGANVNINGPGNILNITFNVLASGSSNFDFLDVEIYNQAGLEIQNVIGYSGSFISGNSSSAAIIKAYLEGPYTSNTMTSHPYMPMTSPYEIAPANLLYSYPNMVDWVLVELRTSASSVPVNIQSAVLYTDGSIRSANKKYLFVQNLSPGNYYVKLVHRNHLPLESLVPMPFSSIANNINDLSLATNVNLSSSVSILPNNLVALMSGDANSDGYINMADKTQLWNHQSGTKGYLAADYNFDGFVLPDDLNEYWRPNYQPLLNPHIHSEESHITYYLGNESIVTQESEAYLVIDILASSSNSSQIGTAIISIDYNGDIFGQNIVSDESQSIIQYSIFSMLTDRYDVKFRNTEQNTLSIVIDFYGETLMPVSIPESPTLLFTLKLKLHDYDMQSGLIFRSDLMQDQQYLSCNRHIFDQVHTIAESILIPGAPSSISLSRSGTGIIISWSQTNGYLYNVYRKTNLTDNWVLVAEELNQNFWIEPVTGSRYLYYITAFPMRRY